MSSINALIKCGDFQRELFFSSFLTHNRPGEIVCVNNDSNGDSYIFEHWQINGVDFVACFRLLSEDSLIVEDVAYQYVSHERFLKDKSEQQRLLHDRFLEKLKEQGRTLKEAKAELERQGRDPSILDMREYTREMLEERLLPGKKTIQGDRYTNIEVLERQKEIPNDLQRPRLNQYFLTPSVHIQDFIKTDVTELERLKEIGEEWKRHFLVEAPRGIGLNTTLPFYQDVIDINPIIYEFPAKELNIE